MRSVQRGLSFVFLLVAVFAFWQCAQKGNPTGGPKDVTPPVLLKSEPANRTTNFKAKKIRLYFDEYIKLKDVQSQLIVSPPLKYTPQIKPLGGASKFIEIILKDTLRENTTYTINFGQSIVDHNEGNPASFLSYVFSTGDYLDSLQLSGAVKDAYNRTADQFVSVMLYAMDTTYTDSTIYKYPPNYITNTFDSVPFFTLKNLKAGKYALFAITDKGKNNVFDQRVDKIGFLSDTISLPTDSVYLLNQFLEEPDYKVSVPSYVAKNHILFGYAGDEKDFKIQTLTQLPDSVKTYMNKDREKDTINFWLTPTDIDSIIFTVTNEKLKLKDTFTVKTRKLPMDTLTLSPGQGRSLDFKKPFFINASTPIVEIDTSLVSVMKEDSTMLGFKMAIDSIKNMVNVDFEKEEKTKYYIELLPGAIKDFFGEENDTLRYSPSTAALADLGDLTINLEGQVVYPVIVQLIDDKGETLDERYTDAPKPIEFNNLQPSKYGFRVVFDSNGNQKWDTGNYLKNRQPEIVKYYPDMIDVRAFSLYNETFIIRE